MTALRLAAAAGDLAARDGCFIKSRMIASVPGARAALPSEDLVEAVGRHRDRAAFAELFRRFAPRLKSYLLRHGAADGRAEEIVQEAMLTVWRRADSFDRRQAGVATWLFTIARNKRIDLVRRERRPEVEPDDPALVGAPPPTPDDAVAARRAAERLRLAIEDLPDEQMAILRMAFFEDRTHSEIAAETALPLGTVKSRIRLAVARLRQIVGEEP